MRVCADFDDGAAGKPPGQPSSPHSRSAFDEESGDGEVLDGDADGIVNGDLVGVGASGGVPGHDLAEFGPQVVLVDRAEGGVETDRPCAADRGVSTVREIAPTSTKEARSRSTPLPFIPFV